MISGALFLLFLLLQYVQVISARGSVRLTPETFEPLTKGKTVFLKCYAPWCDHCKALAPDWERLGKEFEDDQVLVIGEVDCTVHEEWCRRLGIDGFPTLLYGDPSNDGVFLKEYTSLDKSFDDLLQFVQSNLREPICSPGNLAACDNPSIRLMLKEILAYSDDELDSNIAALESKIAATKQIFSDTIHELQTNYDSATHAYQMNKAKIKRRLALLKHMKKV